MHEILIDETGSYNNHNNSVNEYHDEFVRRS